MTLETFFEKFNQFADAPGAVAKMRELVMNLAIQGKLVDQDPAEEDAEITLARVLRDRDRQAKSLRIKDPSPVIADDEHTPALPSGWCYASPDQLTAFHKNSLTIGPFGSSLLKSDYADEGVPLVFVRDIRSENFEGPETRFVSKEKAEELASHTVKPGDLLITKMGDPPGDTAIYPAGRPPAIITADCIKLTPHTSLVEAEYLRFAIRASQIVEQFAGITLGVAQQKVSLGRFRCIAVPLPPLAEQKRIVAKVDELMALCDRLEAQQQERTTKHAALARAALARFADAPTPANLPFLFHPSYAIPPADLRKAILTLAVQGKLVPQDPNDEPAQPAIAQIERERERLIAAKQFRRSQLPGPIDEGPFNIPETWVWTHLGNAMLNVTDGFHSTPKTVESGVRYVTAKHVKPGLIDFDSCLYVSEVDFKEIASKTRPRKGDVLVVNIGAGSGLASIIEADFEFAFKNVAILNRPEEVDSKFLFNYLVFKQDEIFEEQTKGGAQPFLSLGLIRQIPFPLPPLAEQRRIVAKVEQLMALVDALETQFAASRAIAANLLSALVAELTTS